MYYFLVVMLELIKFTPVFGLFQAKAGPCVMVFNTLLGLGLPYTRIERLPGFRKVSIAEVFDAEQSWSFGCSLGLIVL